jgi:pimeloyl-ACP methyl ester carboxylesterase
MADSPPNHSCSLGEKLLRWFRRGVLALVTMLVVLACLGATYQAIGNWRDGHRLPQRGRSVQAGPIRMNIYCTGVGTPTVILEQGGGMPAIGWMKIEPKIAEFTRVCSYDRAGYGWSEPGPMPRTIPRMAKELKTLLDASGEKGPFVMAAVSLGGPIVRFYTGLYPNDVAGVILIDASHEEQQKRLQSVQPPELIAENNTEIASYERWERIRGPVILHLGFERFMWLHFMRRSVQMPQEFWEEYLYLSQRRGFKETMASEIQSLAESTGALRAVNLGDRPLIVLTAGKMTFTPEPFLTKEIEDKIRNVWIHELQAEQARLSTRGKQIIVPDSGHVIMFERPDAVISAIHEVWSAAKATNN